MCEKLITFFYHELGNRCFIIKQVFRKKQYFRGKKCEKSFVGGHTSLRGGGRLATKNNINFFVGIEVLNIFH